MEAKTESEKALYNPGAYTRVVTMALPFNCDITEIMRYMAQYDAVCMDNLILKTSLQDHGAWVKIGAAISKAYHTHFVNLSKNILQKIEEQEEKIAKSQ